MVNLLGSHDTIRLATYLKRRHPDALRLHYLSLAVTLAMAGMPLIYYGDEIALEGDVDPDNRRAFLWERTEEKPVQELKKLARFRAASEILKKGSLIPLDLDERVLAFRRAYGAKACSCSPISPTRRKRWESRPEKLFMGMRKSEIMCFWINTLLQF